MSFMLFHLFQVEFLHCLLGNRIIALSSLVWCGKYTMLPMCLAALPDVTLLVFACPSLVWVNRIFPISSYISLNEFMKHFGFKYSGNLLHLVNLYTGFQIQRCSIVPLTDIHCVPACEWYRKLHRHNSLDILQFYLPSLIKAERSCSRGRIQF